MNNEELSRRRAQNGPYWAKECSELRTRLFRFARRLTNGNDSLADDLVQDTIVRVLHYSPGQIQNPFSYLCSILRRVWISQWRKLRNVKMISLDDEANAAILNQMASEETIIPELFANDEFTEALRQGGGPMKPREKELLKLYLEGNSCDAIAKIRNEDIRITRSDLNALRNKVRLRLKKRFHKTAAQR